MDNIYNWLSLLTSVGTTLIASIITWLIFKKDSNKTYLKERYEKVIFPIFSLLEPHLYKKEITDEIVSLVEQCKKIIEDNKMIAGGKIFYVFCLHVLNKDTFQDMSRFIDKEYDVCCSALGIPLRPLDYKAYSFGARNVRILSLFIVKYAIISIFGMCILMLMYGVINMFLDLLLGKQF